MKSTQKQLCLHIKKPLKVQCFPHGHPKYTTHWTHLTVKHEKLKVRPQKCHKTTGFQAEGLIFYFVFLKWSYTRGKYSASEKELKSWTAVGSLKQSRCLLGRRPVVRPRTWGDYTAHLVYEHLWISAYFCIWTIGNLSLWRFTKNQKWDCGRKQARPWVWAEDMAK